MLAAVRPTRMLALTLAVALPALTALGCASGGGAAGSFSPHTAGTLTVATALVPDPGFWEGTFAHPTGGFEYELARELAARLGLARVKVVEVPFHELVRGHLGGADVAISDMTITEERAQHLDFSEPYLKAPPAIVVRPGTEVADVNAARALRWSVQHDTTLKSELEAKIEPAHAPLVFEHQREVLAALRGGRANAVMLDLPVALAYARETPTSYKVAAQLPSEAELGVALPQGSHNTEAVDSAIRGLKSEGAIDRLAQRWLDQGIEEGADEDVPVLRAGE